MDRLDFTVIGPAVNEAARMSAMCRSLGQDILVSQAFADAAPRTWARLVPLGSHRLRGVTREQALYGVAPPALPANTGSDAAPIETTRHHPGG
jgi:adenylate cyclase